MRHVTVVVVLSALAMFAACSGGPPQAPAPPFAALVDEYLDQFARRHPSIAHACRPTSPPLEPNSVKSYYYITDAQADWPIEQQNGWLQKFNYPTLTDISAHEVVPGHYVHSLFMRRTHPGRSAGSGSD